MCHACPTTLQDCFDCNFDSVNGVPTCSVCNPGFHLGTDGLCVAGTCPMQTDATWSNGTCTPCSLIVDYCDVCVTGFDTYGRERVGCA